MTESTDNVAAFHWTLVHPTVRYNIAVGLKAPCANCGTITRGRIRRAAERASAGR